MLAIMGFFGFANVYAMRVNLSVAVVAMVNSSAIPHVNTSSADACPANVLNSTSEDTQVCAFVFVCMCMCVCVCI